MKLIKLKKIFTFLSLTIFFLLLTKVDFRISEPQQYHSHDDASYYFHAYTLGIDFDLDYSNQISNSNSIYTSNYLNKKTIPSHPIGTGLLSSPFVFLGNLLEKIFYQTEQGKVTYFFYSLSSIFYFFLIPVLIQKTINNFKPDKKIKYIKVLFLVTGSGLPYYAFERFSMTHVYESFAVALIMYLSSIFNRKVYFLVAFLSVFFLLIRWVNYFLILIPFFLLIENSQKLKIKNYLIYNKLYYFGLLTGSSIFLLHTKYLYGFYSFNPGRILSYGVSPLNIIDEYLLKHKLYNLFDPRIVIEVILDFYRILFSQEFGLLWFSPVLFFLFYVIARFLFSKKISLFFILALIVSIPTGLVILWLTAASSFGYRYLFCLIPLAIYVCFEYLNKTELKILYVLNLISIILYLVFETNELTSLRSQVNIFNEFTCCSARYYINGAFDSFMQLTTFIKIIGTSFISVFIFKVLSSFISLENSITLLDNFGVNVNDVSEIIIYSFNISYFEISIYIALISFFTYKATKEYYNF